MHRIFALAATAGLATAAPVYAQDFTLDAGVAFASDYVFRGLTQNEGRPVVQPYLEFGLSGFYASIWGSNVRFPDNGDNVEVELSFGYRGDFDRLSFDLGYARYFYDDTGDCCGEIQLALAYAADYGMVFGTDLTYDHTDEFWTASIIAGYEFDHMWSASAEFGRVEGSYNWWNVGVGLSVTENVSFDFRVHDTNISSTRWVALVSFDFSLR